LESLGLRAILTEDLGELKPDDDAVVIAPSDRLIGAGRTADLIVSRGGRASVAVIPRGAESVAAAVFAGATASEFLAAAANPTAGGEEQGSRDGPLASYRPFPVDALPEPLATFVEVGAAAIGCDASFIALPLLSAVGAAIGNSRRLGLKSSWLAPPIIWTAIVGESGTQKSPAFKLALQAITEAQKRAFAEHAASMDSWEVEYAKWEKEHAAWKKDPDLIEPPPEPERPRPRRYLVSDTTTEALAPILLENPRGLLIVRDELSGWINSFDRYSGSGKGGADAAHWLSMHDGAELTIDRKMGRQIIHVPSASVCVTGGIQPQILARVMSGEHRENGMLARLLFAMPPRRKRLWTEAETPKDITDAVALVFQGLLDLESETDDDGTQHPLVLQLSAEGKRAWVAFYDSHAEEQAGMVGGLAAAWSKLEGYAARFALVIHLCRIAAGDESIADARFVDEASVCAGVTLARWFGQEARRVYGVLNEPEEDTAARELAEWITTKHGGSVTVRDLTHGLRRFRNNVELAEEALDDLEARGLGRRRLFKNPRGGPSSMRFYLEALHVTVTRTPLHDAMHGGSGDGDTSEGSRTHGAA
ncbi:MAG: YfjI family protein, partial [Phycisphaerales bacterium JB041]